MLYASTTKYTQCFFILVSVSEQFGQNIPIHHLISEQRCIVNNQILHMQFVSKIRIMSGSIPFYSDGIIARINTKSKRVSIIFFEGVASQNFYKMMYFGSDYFLSNFADHHKMPPYVALHLGLHVFQCTHKDKK